MPRIYNFSALSAPGNTLVQDIPNGFGPKSADTFRLTSSFQITSDLPAYAIVKGTVLLQMVGGRPELVNLVLRPWDQLDSLLPVKYIIYRGLKKMDFLTTNAPDISDPSTIQIKTSGSGYINAIQSIQLGRSLTDPVDLHALFGFDLSPAGTRSIDDFFLLDDAPCSQLFTAEAGLHLGDFYGGDTIGIDIILENAEYSPTVGMVNKTFHEITGAAGSGIDKRFIREQVRHFIDPAAFYGLYIDEPIGYAGGATTNKQEVYEKILSPFCTKNTIYLDIRNENGYSYNYYQNYTGSGSNQPENEKELKTGPATGSLQLQEYYTDGWPVHLVSNVIPHASDEDNSFFIALRKNDNEKPLVFGRKCRIEPKSAEDNKGIFISEAELTGVDQEWTKAIQVKVPNLPGVGGGNQPATLVRLDYIKQIRYNETTTDSYPYKERTDFLFGPININIPWRGNGTKWMNSNFQKYMDGASQGFMTGTTTSPVVAINPALKTITINRIGTAGWEIAENVAIINTGPNNQNAGKYSIIRIVNTTTQTTITVKEVIPATLQTGDSLRFDVVVYFHMDKADARKLIIPQADLTGIQAFQASRKVRLYTISLNKYGANFIQSNQLSGSNTIITLQFEVFGFGFGAIMETGIVAEKIDTPTGGEYERVLFYAVPQFYLNAKGVDKRNFFNFKGGTTSSKSLFSYLSEIAPGFKIDKETLQPTQGNFLATVAYAENSTNKNFLLLGLKKSEVEFLALAAFTQLSSFHLKMLKLVPVGNRQRDTDYESYYKYNLVVAGMGVNGQYLQTTAGIEVFSRDGSIFASQDYASSEFLPASVIDSELDVFVNSHVFGSHLDGSAEERNQLKSQWLNRPGTSNEDLLNIDPVIGNLIEELKTELDLLPDDEILIADLAEQKGAELLTLSRQRIRQNNIQPGGTYSTKNKDGIIYLARLSMLVVLKNHVRIRDRPFKNRILSIFEKASRGLEGSAKASFSAYPSTYKKILITGFDPFGAGKDWEGFNSNPSGNVALSLDGIIKTGGSNTGVIRSVLFPVRYIEFDAGWVEDFFNPLINSVDLIITFSYGIDTHDFQIDRFASSYRNGGIGDNNFQRRESGNLGSAGFNETFIENKLPYLSLVVGDDLKINVPSNDCKIAINHRAYWKLYADKNTPAIPGMDVTEFHKDKEKSNGPAFPGQYLIPIKKIAPFNPNNDYGNAQVSSAVKYVDSSDADFIKFPSWANYPDTEPWVADYSNFQIKARMGSGQFYFSNELHYRVASVRQIGNPNLKTGHIHIGFLETNPVKDRDQMLQAVEYIVQKFLERL